MGYTTVFKGHFTFCCALDDETYKLLAGLESTRRMKRKFRKTDGYGVDGEFYVAEDEPVDPATGKRISTIVDYNVPPRTQPSLWLHWIPSEDRRMLHWSGGGLKGQSQKLQTDTGGQQRKNSMAMWLGSSTCAKRYWLRKATVSLERYSGSEKTVPIPVP